mmetsp:Transcript_136228/g.303492  ORF Transcript_136228/g.303492 Transcript_136228/m.303492 type:complete len:279 (-) Transcript_136228:1473-2309(-)
MSACPAAEATAQNGACSTEHLREDLLLALLLLLQEFLQPVEGLFEVRILRLRGQALLDVLHGISKLPKLLPTKAPAEQGLDTPGVKLKNVIARGLRLLVEGLRCVLAVRGVHAVRSLEVALRAVQMARDLDLLALLSLFRRDVAHKFGPRDVLNGLLVAADCVIELLGLEHVVALVLILCRESQTVLLLHDAVVLVEIHAQLLASLPLLRCGLLQGFVLFLPVLHLLLKEGGALALHEVLRLLQLGGIRLQRGDLLCHVCVLKPEHHLVEEGVEHIGL